MDEMEMGKITIKEEEEKKMAMIIWGRIGK